MKYITPSGYKKLRKELRDYEKRTAKIVLMKGEAADVGGDKWHDNFSFEEIERLQKVYSARITELKRRLRNAVVLSEAQLKRNARKNKVCIGSKVKIRYQNNRTGFIKIVGSGESNPDKGLIAYDTPFGKCLINKKPGQKTFCTAGAKQTKIEILNLIKSPD